MVTRVDGRDIRTKRGVKGWAGWTPVSEEEKDRFQELVLHLLEDHNTASPGGNDEVDGLHLLHDRLVNAAAENKAATTSSRNKIKILCI